MRGLLRLSALSVLSLAALVLPAGPVGAQGLTRSFYVNVVDSQGKPVTDLTTADLVLKENGKEREIASFGPAREKLRIALMLEEVLQPDGNVRTGLAEFIKRMAPQAEIALVLVGQRNTVAVDYTSDVSALFTGLNNLARNVPGSVVTLVPEGIFDMAKALGRGDRPARPVMVLVGIERDQARGEDPENVIKELGRSNAGLFVVAIDGGGSGTPDMTGRSKVFNDGTKQSGGRRLQVTGTATIPAALQSVAADLENQSVVTFSLPADVKPSDRISLTTKKKGVTLRAPSRIADR